MYFLHKKTVWITVGIVGIHQFTKAAITFPTTAFCLLGTFAPDNGQILARTTIGNLGLYVDTWRQLSMGNSWRDFHDIAPMATVMEPILGGKSWKHERHPKTMCLYAMHASCSNVLMRLLFRWPQDTTILDPLLLGEAARKSQRSWLSEVVVILILCLTAWILLIRNELKKELCQLSLPESKKISIDITWKGAFVKGGYQPNRSPNLIKSWWFEKVLVPRPFESPPTNGNVDIWSDTSFLPTPWHGFSGDFWGQGCGWCEWIVMEPTSKILPQSLLGWTSLPCDLANHPIW